VQQEGLEDLAPEHDHKASDKRKGLEWVWMQEEFRDTAILGPMLLVQASEQFEAHSYDGCSHGER
jgi:hypothetical protein